MDRGAIGLEGECPDAYRRFLERHEARNEGDDQHDLHRSTAARTAPRPRHRIPRQQAVGGAMPTMTRPWPEVVARYDDFKGEHASIRAVGALAQRITQSPLAKGLHAWTSMFDLCIVQIPVSYPFDGPFLR